MDREYHVRPTENNKFEVYYQTPDGEFFVTEFSKGTRVENEVIAHLIRDHLNDAYQAGYVTGQTDEYATQLEINGGTL